MRRRAWERTVLGVALVVQAAVSWLVFPFLVLGGIDRAPESVVPFAWGLLALSLIVSTASAGFAFSPKTPIKGVARVFLATQCLIQLALIVLMILVAHPSQVFVTGDPAPADPGSPWAMGLAACFSVVLLGVIRLLLLAEGHEASDSSAGGRVGFGASLAAAALVLVCFGVAGALAALDSTRLGCKSFDFERADWEESERLAGELDGWEDRRTSVARNLDRCGTLVGLTREEVGAMIGKAGHSSKVSHNLGRAPGIFAEYLLYVEYDAAGFVRDTGIDSITT